MERIEKIKYIKESLETFGGFTTGDVEADCSPLHSSGGKDLNNLVEEFYDKYARVVSYVHETIVNEFDVTYESLSDDVIDDIYELTLTYVALKELDDKDICEHTHTVIDSCEGDAENGPITYSHCIDCGESFTVFGM